jgi:plasmid maintenance system antidote protein VapI
MTSDSLAAWMERLGFNKVRAAAALGISRNTLDGYLTGKHDIPKTVALACAAIAYGLPEP